MRRILGPALISALLIAWSSSAPVFAARPDVAELRKFLSVPPDARLQAALATSDLRFLGVYGYTLEVPGAPRGDTLPENSVLVIPGTSDDGDAELNERARSYAKAYNVLLARHLANKP